MKALMHRIIVFGGLGLLLSMVGTACTLTGANAAPLTPVGAGDITPLASPTEIGLLPTFVMETPDDVFGGLTATALYDPFAITPGLQEPTGFETPPVLETPIGSGINVTQDPFAVTLAPIATVTPLAPLAISTPTPISIVATPVPAGDSGSCPPTYTVQSGDNLFRIAMRFGLTYQELASANGITNPDALPVGTVLSIPGCGGNAAPASGDTGSDGPVQPFAGDTVDANGDILHTVKAGENLFRIALNYGLRWEEVAAYNGITNPNNISVGQVIRIPRS